MPCPQKDSSFKLRFGVVNTDGTAYAIDNFVVKNATDGKTTIQVVGSNGQVSGTYYWYNEFDDGENVFAAGWFDSTGETPANITLAPGEGVFFNTDESGVSVTIPAAI